MGVEEVRGGGDEVKNMWGQGDNRGESERVWVEGKGR